MPLTAPTQDAPTQDVAPPHGTASPQATPVTPQLGVIRESVLPHGSAAQPGSVLPAAAVPDAPAEVTIVCPECGAPSTVSLARRDAGDFCPICDYPMFWARPQDRKGAAQDGVDDARWRSPGASGASLIATVPCPACRELNVPSAVVCVRCGADMNPPPPPEPEPVPLPEPAPVPQEIREPEPAEPFPWWWFATVLALVGVAWYVSIRY
ncbi:double zinc ribbon [mine drainage metagenome]|uniref:Double zinc ribbon n=1 Tax=mine drainage metagenome TaxID=410659 RepID=A0A1J5R9W3_9ZZZZ